MEKGKSGLTLAALATIAFVLCYLQWTTVLILVLGFVLLVEKDEWLSKEVVKAFYLLIGYNVLVSVINIAFSIIQQTIGQIGFLGSIFGTIDSLLSSLLKIAFLLICLLAGLKVAKGGVSNVPIVDKLADTTMGIVKNNTQQ